MVTTRMHPVPAHGPGDGARGAASVLGLRGRQQWEQANRRGLLAVHGLVGTSAGTLILFNGTAQAFDDLGPWSREATGLLALVGGLVLLVGLGRHRSVRLEVAGLVLLATWYLTMATGFVAGAVSADEITIDWPWHVIGDISDVRLYPIALYTGLFLMMCVHLVTLRQIQRVDRRSRVRVLSVDG